MVKQMHRKDYKEPKFLIKKANLKFNIKSKSEVIVGSELDIESNQDISPADLELNANFKYINLLYVYINSKLLKPNIDYKVDKENNTLTIFDIPSDKFKLQVANKLNPEANKSCKGLYISNDIITTHCEAQGFRNITPYLDRPDVLAKYKVTIEADEKSYPILLSNGNLIKEDSKSGRYIAEWEDPYPKPSYLFALNAADLQTLTDHYITKSGKKVTLKIHVNRDSITKTSFAMDCLKKGLKWFEDKYGYEYDLNIYQLVGIPDFNAGAMENKSLNHFNDSCMLANPYTTLDKDFAFILRCVVHEYMHNRAGNRVTVKNWFNLNLKEGLATALESEANEDLLGKEAIVARIKEVLAMRLRQFPEDSGPLSHQVRPDSVASIDNLYTSTIYQKGAEILKMLRGMIGEKLWVKGLQHYFDKYDGKAVTVDEFLSAMQTVSNKNLKQFSLWYSQKGTPILDVTDEYDAKNKIYKLKITQSCTQESSKLPFLIPISIGLLDKNGKDIVAKTLELNKKSQTFEFKNIKEKPYLSLLRDFSAPVKIRKNPCSKKDLLFLMQHDNNELNRWDASQTLAKSSLKEMIKALEVSFQIDAIVDLNKVMQKKISIKLLQSYKKVLNDNNCPNGLKALILNIPSPSSIMSEMDKVNPKFAVMACRFFSKELAKYLQSDLLKTYMNLKKGMKNSYSPKLSSDRMLMNSCLSNLAMVDKRSQALCVQQYRDSKNMTNIQSALKALLNSKQKFLPAEQKTINSCLEHFYKTWKEDHLVLQDWLAIQAGSASDDCVENVAKILNSDKFNITNPNNVRSLIRTFTSNINAFHREDGAGYKLLAGFVVKLDKYNQEMAGKILKPLAGWDKVCYKNKILMLKQLLILDNKKSDLSTNVKDIISLGLKNIDNSLLDKLKKELNFDKSISNNKNKFK